jgi:hypothetical protein
LYVFEMSFFVYFSWSFSKLLPAEPAAAVEAPSAPATAATHTTATVAAAGTSTSHSNSNAPTLLELLSRTCMKRWPKPDWRCSPVLDIMLAAEFDVLRRRVQVWQFCCSIRDYLVLRMVNVLSTTFHLQS